MKLIQFRTPGTVSVLECLDVPIPNQDRMKFDPGARNWRRNAGCSDPRWYLQFHAAASRGARPRAFRHHRESRRWGHHATGRPARLHQRPRATTPAAGIMRNSSRLPQMPPFSCLVPSPSTPQLHSATTK